MRFFSNEAKDNVDDQDVRTDAVPQQRPGSPWDDRPGDNTDVVHDPAPQPTAFGAATPGGAVAASAMAGPYDDPDHDTHRSTDAASGVADDRTVALGDGVIDDDRSRANDDTVAWPVGEAPADRDPDVDVPLDDHRDTTDRTDDDRDTTERIDDDRIDGVAEDRDAVHDAHDGADDDSHVAVHRADVDQADDPVDAKRVEDGNRVEDAEVDEALEDRGTFDDPQVVDQDESGRDTEPAVVEPIVAAPVVAEPVAVAPVTDPEPTLEPEPVVAVAAVPEPSAPVASAGPATLFPEAETQPLRDRWRDIQLRFVDDPKASTAEAATLVDETIEKLTAALREHRGSLAGGGDDTEALRVELRSYRDILDRLLGL
jgi:hypothetical protein